VEYIEKNATTRNQMTPRQRINYITKWIKSYATKNKIKTLVVGVSGGIDSAVVSTLCARTGIYTMAVSMPIRQSKHTHELSVKHAYWLTTQFDNAENYTVDLTPTFKQFEKATSDLFDNELAFANSRSRLRMMTLYQIAQATSGIVVGTGNKVEDFGVGFFTKYGDGGVDISPIGDCMKTDVWAMGRELGIMPEIIDAAPTDGLWADGRTDEDQIGMTYPELERMMALDFLKRANIVDSDMPSSVKLSADDRKKLKRYQELRARNLHKMQPIPVCMMPKDKQ
jgi:NAD+ synthase